jgi:hypothetical protein
MVQTSTEEIAMTQNIVWIVFIEGCFCEGETEKDVYRVFADRQMAEVCAKEIEDNKHNKKFDGIWVSEAWVSDEYVIH